MKIFTLIILLALFTQSCNHSSKIKKEEQAPVAKEEIKFFPVTNYIKGQIFEISQKGINPIKYTTVKNHSDSVWLKSEELNEAFKEFLNPNIDSTNLISLFTEKKFMDQTINAFTFTYDATGKLPDTMSLKHWDVYIDPATGNVKRIYLVKNIGINKILQLTWLNNKWCKMITIVDEPNGNSFVEKEEKISWDFINQ